MVYTHWCWFFEMVFWDGLWFYHITGQRKDSIRLVDPQTNSTKKKRGGAFCPPEGQKRVVQSLFLEDARNNSRPSSRIFHLQTTIFGTFPLSLNAEHVRSSFKLLSAAGTVFQVLKRIPGSGKKPWRSFLRVVQPVALCIPGWPAVAILGKPLISGFDARF